MEELIEQYKKGQISRTDLERELKVYFDNMQEPDAQFVDHKKEEMWQVIMEHRVPGEVEGKVVRFKWWKYAVAAIFIMSIASTYLLLYKRATPVALSQAQRFKNDITPGREGAVLKLSDGREILLDTVSNGNITPGFTKTGDGLSVQGSAVEYATVLVPRARTEKVTLPDGSIVWLNAGSSIMFPTRFSGNTREVIMTGEVYFEVAPLPSPKRDTKIPFIVKTPYESVQVLGTHFNVNTYSGKNVTTLLEGKVQIANAILKPGEQYDKGKITTPDTEEVMAWKNGIFLFNNTPITEIMAQVERWYDVEIKYEGNTSKLVFGGDMERAANVSVLLKKLELTKSVEFTIEGKTITVKPIN